MAGTAAAAATAALGGDKNGMKNFDQPPVWDGADPAKQWRRCRRDVWLWHMDTDLDTSKHGTRFYRSLIGDAKGAAECGLTDEDIVGEEGFDNILKFFDTSYTVFMEIADDVDFDNGHEKEARR